jgi:hypothetical protein
MRPRPESTAVHEVDPRASKLKPPKVTKPPRVLEDGAIIYEKEGWEPPPVPPGYRRKSDDLSSPDAWILVPEKPLCKQLKLLQVEKECGCIRVSPICAHNGKHEIIERERCSQCPHRKERDV